MRVEVLLVLNIDPEANFFKACRDDPLEDIQEVIEDSIYDIDDMTLEDIEVFINE